MTLLLALLGQFWPYILAGLAALAWGLKQRRAGAASERAKQAKADQRVRDISDDVQNDVRAMSPEQVDAELRARAPKK